MVSRLVRRLDGESPGRDTHLEGTGKWPEQGVNLEPPRGRGPCRGRSGEEDGSDEGSGAERAHPAGRCAPRPAGGS